MAGHLHCLLQSLTAVFAQIIPLPSWADPGINASRWLWATGSKQNLKMGGFMKSSIVPIIAALAEVFTDISLQQPYPLGMMKVN